MSVCVCVCYRDLDFKPAVQCKWWFVCQSVCVWERKTQRAQSLWLTIHLASPHIHSYLHTHTHTHTHTLKLLPSSCVLPHSQAFECELCFVTVFFHIILTVKTLFYCCFHYLQFTVSTQTSASWSLLKSRYSDDRCMIIHLTQASGHFLFWLQRDDVRCFFFFFVWPGGRRIRFSYE